MFSASKKIPDQLNSYEAVDIIRLKSSLIIATLALLFSGCAATSTPIKFNHLTYELSSQQANTEVYRADGGQSIVIERSQSSTTVRVGSDSYVVSGSLEDMSVKFPDGRVVESKYTGDVTTGLATYGTNVSVADWDRVDELHTLVFNPQQNRPAAVNPWKILLVGILLITGAVNLLKPRLAWLIRDGWKYKFLEPNEIYLGIIRLSGIIIILVAMFLVFQ